MTQLRPLALLLLAAFAVSGCAADRSGTPSDQGSVDGEGVGADLTVVATVFPLAWLAQELAPAATVHFLGAGGQDPHDLELSPAERATLQSADVVLSMGDIGFQPQIERALDDASGEVVSVAGVAGEERLRTVENTDDAIDPHVWFDPAIMADVAEQAGDVFAEADPAHAEAYRGEAARLVDVLTELDGELDALLADCRFDTAFVSHEAYAYLLAPRGFDQVGVSGASGHSEASPRRLAELARVIEDEGIPAVGAEPVEGRDDVEALAAETGATVVEIHPLSPPYGEQAENYPQLLRAQGEAFASLLECT